MLNESSKPSAVTLQGTVTKIDGQWAGGKFVTVDIEGTQPGTDIKWKLSFFNHSLLGLVYGQQVELVVKERLENERL